jgi:hypothetical protein
MFKVLLGTSSLVLFFSVAFPPNPLCNPSANHAITNKAGVASLHLVEDNVVGGDGPYIGDVALTSTPFNDSGWNLVYQENFDSAFEASDGQSFGTDNWLVFQLLNGGAISVANGYAQLSAPDFWNAALIRSTSILPAQYKVRTKIGYINYDLANYEQADFDNPDFNDHGERYENGMYFLTVTDDTCSGNECAEEWWHYHRKMVIDVDNHLNSRGDEIVHPVYMVFMGYEVNSVGNVLRTWDGADWDSSAWNWNVAYTYESNTWYYAELEKRDNQIILRLYDDNLDIIEETTPVDLGVINAMDNPTEYLYLGEPHTDDYEGDVRIDEITLWFPTSECCSGFTGNVDDDPSDMIDIGDLTALIDYLFISFTEPVCMGEANIDGDPTGIIDLGDLTALIDYLFITFAPPAECL